MTSSILTHDGLDLRGIRSEYFENVSQDALSAADGTIGGAA